MSDIVESVRVNYKPGYNIHKLGENYFTKGCVQYNMPELIVHESYFKTGKSLINRVVDYITTQKLEVPSEGTAITLRNAFVFTGADGKGIQRLRIMLHSVENIPLLSEDICNLLDLKAGTKVMILTTQDINGRLHYEEGTLNNNDPVQLVVDGFKSAMKELLNV